MDSLFEGSFEVSVSLKVFQRRRIELDCVTEGYSEPLCGLKSKPKFIRVYISVVWFMTIVNQYIF